MRSKNDLSGIFKDEREVRMCDKICIGIGIGIGIAELTRRKNELVQSMPSRSNVSPGGLEWTCPSNPTTKRELGGGQGN